MSDPTVSGPLWMSKKTSIILGILVAIVVLVAGYFQLQYSKQVSNACDIKYGNDTWCFVEVKHDMTYIGQVWACVPKDNNTQCKEWGDIE